MCACIHAQLVERYVSSDRTTVAGEPGQASPNASPFLSPSPSSSFLFFSFFLSQRQPNEAKTARGTPVASGSLFSSASNALAPLLRPSDCSVYCTSTTIPRLEKIDHEETNLAVYIRLSLSLSAISFGLYTRKRTFHAYQSNLFYRQEDLIGFIERMNGRLEGERTTVRSILNDTGLVQDS